MMLLHQIKVLEATHQSTLYIFISLYSIIYIYINVYLYFYIYTYKYTYIYIYDINLFSHLQGNIHYIVTAEISAQIDHCHT